MLPTLPLEIWELIFGFLPGQDLELISKVESLIPPLDVSLSHTLTPRDV